MRHELTDRIGPQKVLFLFALFFLLVPSQVFESGTTPAGEDDQTEDRWGDGCWSFRAAWELLGSCSAAGC
jgi:hypothetical protein